MKIKLSPFQVLNKFIRVKQTHLHGLCTHTHIGVCISMYTDRYLSHNP